MNIIDFNNQEFQNTEVYKDFIKNNPSNATLNIRASSANFAVPVEGVKIIVSKTIDNYKVIFFEGLTDESGMINQIILPTPSIVENDLDIPNATPYDIEAIYEKDNVDNKYVVLMYPGICVIQNINLIPTLVVSSMEVEEYGS